MNTAGSSRLCMLKTRWIKTSGWYDCVHACIYIYCELSNLLISCDLLQGVLLHVKPRSYRTLDHYTKEQTFMHYKFAFQQDQKNVISLHSYYLNQTPHATDEFLLLFLLSLALIALREGGVSREQSNNFPNRVNTRWTLVNHWHLAFVNCS